MNTEKRKGAWSLVLVISAALAIWLGYLWAAHDCCSFEDIEPVRLDHQINEKLAEAGSDDLFRLTTGVYVQSLSFESANDVQLTGRLWQRLQPGEKIPEGAEQGVIFPDAISGHGSNLTVIYDDFKLSGTSASYFLWNFQVTLRQEFDNSDYPLDGKRVWVRLWTKDLENQVQLVPDLGAYKDAQNRSCLSFDGMEAQSCMGIAESLVSGEWSVQDTFFTLHQMTYGTDFGRDQRANIGKPLRPELRFYVVLKRNFIDAFLVNLVPLFVTFGLLFGLMMTVSRESGRANRLGFNTMAVFGSCSGLFFITLLGHIQVRQQFPGSQIVYIEYFYIISYLIILFVSVFSFMITYAENPRARWYLRNDGHNVKLIYWPAVLGLLLVLSFWKLGVPEGMLGFQEKALAIPAKATAFISDLAG